VIFQTRFIQFGKPNYNLNLNSATSLMERGVGTTKSWHTGQILHCSHTLCTRKVPFNPCHALFDLVLLPLYTACLRGDQGIKPFVYQFLIICLYFLPLHFSFWVYFLRVHPFFSVLNTKPLYQICFKKKMG
jgi:hypothetical protein